LVVYGNPEGIGAKTNTYDDEKILLMFRHTDGVTEAVPRFHKMYMYGLTLKCAAVQKNAEELVVIDGSQR
jgi:hypothetical protein